eukprot:XP_001697716.1 hypothetical protein CHLREDRAFT_205684 [Chlamydomonas reinhardtii]
MLASLSRQAGALVRHVESATAAHGSISACITQPLPTGSGLLCCGSSQSCAPSYSTAAVHWQEGACRSSDGGDGNTNSSSGCTSTSGHWAARSASTTHRWRRALGCSAESKVVDWTREEDQPGSGASIAVLVAPFTSLALRMGLGSRGGILAARRLRGEPEPFEDEQDDDEYEDGEYVDLDDEELLGDLDELDEMEIDGEAGLAVVKVRRAASVKGASQPSLDGAQGRWTLCTHAKLGRPVPISSIYAVGKHSGSFEASTFWRILKELRRLGRLGA